MPHEREMLAGRIMYKKKMCKFGDNCKHKEREYMCKFAHYPEEKKKLKFNKPEHRTPPYKTSRTLRDYNLDYFDDNNMRWIFDCCHDNSIPKISIEICNNVGVYQLLLKKKIGFGINKIMSYLNIKKMLECKDTLDECKWCRKMFSYKYDDDEIRCYRMSLKCRNNPFINNEFRKTCNIGPLCLKCALYKIPIRCDICKKYTNANNMEFHYDFCKDTELMKLFTDCEHGLINEPMNTKCIYTTAKNICTTCILGYYQDIMSSGFDYCNICVREYRNIISFRFGPKIEQNYT